MATSGSFDFNYNTIEILEMAARKVGALADGQVLTNEQVDIYKKDLNAMVKAWRADNIFLWEEVFLSLPIQDSSEVSSLGDDYRCILPHTSSSENEPGVGSKWPTFWVLLSQTSVAPAWVILTDYVSANTYILESQIVDVLRMRRKDIPSGNTVPITKVTQEEFFDLADSSTLGTPDQFYFKRDFTPTIQLYPFPNSSTDYLLEFWAWQYPQDFDSNNDNPDFLQDWLEALVDGLAVRLAPSAGIFGSQLKDLQNISAVSKDRAQKLDHETGDIRFSPNLRFMS